MSKDVEFSFCKLINTSGTGKYGYRVSSHVHFTAFEIFWTGCRMSPAELVELCLQVFFASGYSLFFVGYLFVIFDCADLLSSPRNVCSTGKSKKT